MADIIWHRCSMCGERWAGTHQCAPVQDKPYKAIKEHQYSHAEVGAVIAVAETAQAKIDKLRAELAAIESALRTMSRWAVLADREDPNVEAEMAMKGLRLWREPTGGES